MKHIFYFIGIFFIVSEWLWVMSPLEKTIDAKEFNDLHKQYKHLKWEQAPEAYKDQIKKKFWGVLLFLWLMAGLFTFQWAAFLVIFLFNILIIGPLSKLTRYSMAYTALHWFNSVIGVAFGLFVIINAYHLKIDLWSYLKALFQ